MSKSIKGNAATSLLENHELKIIHVVCSMVKKY